MTSPLDEIKGSPLEDNDARDLKLDLDEVWTKFKGVDKPSIFGKLSYYLKGALSAFIQYPFGTLGCVMILSVGLVFWGAILLFVSPLSDIIASQSLQVPLRVTLAPGVGEAEKNELLKTIEALGGVREAKLYSSLDVLTEMEQRLGRDNPLLVGIGKDSNPFADRILIKINKDAKRDDVGKELRALQKESALVTDVHIVSKTYETLTAILSFVRTVSNLTIFCALFGALLLVVIALQFRFLMRKEEIQIMSLVGATPSFIAAPLIAEGILLSLVGGIVAVGVLSLFEQAFHSTLISSFEGIEPMLSHFTLGTWTKFALILSGVALGVVGSVFAVKREMKE